MRLGDYRVQVEGLSKRYVIGNRSTTAREALAQRIRSAGRRSAPPEFVWSLRDVTFAVRSGESVGFIGRNGAGKSTVLKVLAGITAPTEGEARTRGRIAALLEVGTGFHPELTGRENIYLNGAILGMSLREIRSRFDQIVDFAGVERFLDTPVKRYSSGMRLRLAFAVAAHLEPDILIVDEVLAVGDAEFQRKCLGHMSEAHHEGRTLVFVSHDLETLQQVCKRGIWLDKGRVRQSDDAAAVIRSYLSDGHHGDPAAQDPIARSGGVVVEHASVTSVGGPPGAYLSQSDPVRVEFLLTLEVPLPGVDVAIVITSATGIRVLDEVLSDTASPEHLAPGRYRVGMSIPPLLPAGEYTAGLWLGTAYDDLLDEPVVVSFSLWGSTKGRPQRVVALDLPISVLPAP